MKKYILLVVLLWVAAIGYAQSIRITVVDAETQKGIPYALAYTQTLSFYADQNGLLEMPADLYGQPFIVQQLGYKSDTLILEKGVLQWRLKAAPVVLEEILVAGDRRQGNAQSTIIQDADKQVAQPRDVGDWLSGVPGFGMIKRGGYALDPVFRSFKYEQINLVYDGGVQVTHACPARMDPASTHVSPGDIEKLELIRGPFSVRYGQTMGGVVNIVTRPLQSEHKGWGGALEAGYEFNGDAKLTRMDLRHNSDKFQVLFNGGVKDYGNYEAGNGREIPSSFKHYDYGLKAAYQLSAHQQLQANFRQAYGRDILHPGLMMDTDEDDSSIFSLDYQATNLGKTLYGLNAKIYASQVDHIMSNTLRPNFKASEAVATVQSQTFGGKVEGSVFLNKKNLLYVGTDFRYIGREGGRERLVKVNMMTGEPLSEPRLFQDEIWQDASIANIGVYAENRMLLNERWTATTGLRLDYVSAETGAPSEIFWHYYGSPETEEQLSWSGNMSLNYQAESGFFGNLALGRGTRTPNMIERYITHFTVGLDGYEHLGNPYLDPEKNYQAELSAGVEQQAFSLRAGIFYSYLDDYITAFVDTTVNRLFMPNAQPQHIRRFTNINDARQYGGELEVRFRPVPNWEAWANASYTHATNEDWNEPLAEVPPLEANIGLRYQRDIWWASSRLRLVAEQDRVSVNFGEQVSPGFGVLDLRAGIEPIEGLKFGVSVLNLLDQSYYEHLNRSYRNLSETGQIYETGRNITLLLKYAF